MALDKHVLRTVINVLRENYFIRVNTQPERHQNVSSYTIKGPNFKRG